MTRLADRIVRYGLHHNTITPAGLAPSFAGAQCFAIDNVAEYLYAGTDQENWDPRTDFPNVAPPFPRCWFDHKRPSRINSRVLGDQDASKLPEWTGVFIEAADLGSLPSQAVRQRVWSAAFQVLPIQPVPGGEGGIPALDDGVALRWILRGDVYCSLDSKHNTGPLGSAILAVSADGRAMSTTSVIFASHPHVTRVEPVVAEYLMQMVSTEFNVALLAISMMHCKNVRTETLAALPAKLARAHERRYGQPAVRYHTLEIGPLQSSANAFAPGKSGMVQALHFARGHFKTYTADAPLLGQHVGTYWWDAHLRGSAKSGVVEKDYRVTRISTSRS